MWGLLGGFWAPLVQRICACKAICFHYLGQLQCPWSCLPISQRALPISTHTCFLAIYFFINRAKCNRTSAVSKRNLPNFAFTMCTSLVFHQKIVSKIDSMAFVSFVTLVYGYSDGLILWRKKIFYSVLLSCRAPRP